MAILAPPPPQQAPPQHAPGDPWSAAVSPTTAFSTVDVSSRVLQPQPGFDEMQHTAAHVQQLLMAGHRLEALRQAYLALLLPGCYGTVTHCSEEVSVQNVQRQSGAVRALHPTAVMLFAVSVAAPSCMYASQMYVYLP